MWGRRDPQRPEQGVRISLPGWLPPSSLGRPGGARPPPTLVHSDASSARIPGTSARAQAVLGHHSRTCAITCPKDVWLPRAPGPIYESAPHLSSRSESRLRFQRARCLAADMAPSASESKMRHARPDRRGPASRCSCEIQALGYMSKETRWVTSQHPQPDVRCTSGGANPLRR